MVRWKPCRKSFFVMAVALASLLHAQIPMIGTGIGGNILMIPTDMAILEVQEPRQDLPCSVEPIKPTLGFDLKFHSGYDVEIPMRDLAGLGTLLTMLFRVTPTSHKGEPSYFVQRMEVPPIDAGASGKAYLQGVFDLGEGTYHVDWMMRDRADRVCSSYWDADATLAARDKLVSMAINPGAVQATEIEAFRDEPPVQRAHNDPPLSVKVLLNFAPLDRHSVTLQPLDTSALVSILRTISREPRIGKFSIVAFNLKQQQILYRQDNATHIDFPALGEALRVLNPGTIDLKVLNQKNGETEFLTNLIQKEIGGDDHPDALIFAGPKAYIDDSVPTESLREVGEVEYPVFYMNYNLQPRNSPWRDAIGRAVKFFRGYEFTISRPRDLWAAVSEIVTQTVRYKSERRAMGAASR
jgi:hypothetical protein